MQDAASTAIVARTSDSRDVGQMLALSLAAHAVALALLYLAPWRALDTPEEKVVMTISLGGAPGPQAGGMTSLGGRPVQQEAPPTPPPRPEPVRPPAVKTPAMTVPTPKEKPSPKPPPPPVKTSVDEARGRTPTTGPEVKAGNAVAQTGATGLDIGLSTGGGGTGGEIDLANFCCPEYLSTMIQLISRQWNPRQGIPGQTTMRFTIARDGGVSDVEVVRTSGYAVLDLASRRALLTARLPPLPAAYSNPQLTVNLNFKYQ